MSGRSTEYKFRCGSSRSLNPGRLIATCGSFSSARTCKTGFGTAIRLSFRSCHRRTTDVGCTFGDMVGVAVPRIDKGLPCCLIATQNPEAENQNDDWSGRQPSRSLVLWARWKEREQSADLDWQSAYKAYSPPALACSHYTYSRHPLSFNVSPGHFHRSPNICSQGPLCLSKTTDLDDPGSDASSTL